MSDAPIGGSKNSYLTLDQIRQAEDLAEVDVEVPLWNGKVKVRPLTIDKRREMRELSQERVQAPDGTYEVTYNVEEMELYALVLGCVEPAFSRSDIDWLRKEKSAGAISTVTQVVLNISGLGVQAEKKQESDS